MSWTQKILDFAGGKPWHIYHIFSAIGAGLAWTVFILTTYTNLPILLVFLIGPAAGWLTMLVWEILQHFLDSGFSGGDIISNNKGTTICYLILGVIYVVGQLIIPFMRTLF